MNDVWKEAYNALFDIVWDDMSHIQRQILNDKIESILEPEDIPNLIDHTPPPDAITNALARLKKEYGFGKK